MQVPTNANEIIQTPSVHQWTPRALYIHIPFCTNKCFYFDALENEMKLTVTELPPTVIDTVFVGGGTPTVLTPPQMTRFLASVKKYFPLADNVEFTMEANPGTTDMEKLAAMREGGVNRI